jgi:hypothetical protein
MWEVNIFYGAVNLFLFIRDNLFPERWRDKSSLLDILHKMHWLGWIILILISNIFVLIEGAFRAIRRREEGRTALADKREAIEESRPRVLLREPSPVIFNQVTQQELSNGRIIRTCPFFC